MVVPANVIAQELDLASAALVLSPFSGYLSFTGQPFRLCARMRVMIDRIAEIEQKLEALAVDPDQTRERVDLLTGQ